MGVQVSIDYTLYLQVSRIELGITSGSSTKCKSLDGSTLPSNIDTTTIVREYSTGLYSILIEFSLNSLQCPFDVFSSCELVATCNQLNRKRAHLSRTILCGFTKPGNHRPHNYTLWDCPKSFP